MAEDKKDNSPRVNRRGGWISIAGNCRSASRFGLASTPFRDFAFGFRVVAIASQQLATKTCETTLLAADNRLEEDGGND